MNEDDILERHAEFFEAFNRVGDMDIPDEFKQWLLISMMIRNPDAISDLLESAAEAIRNIFSSVELSSPARPTPEQIEELRKWLAL